jgi:hypothetical protein
MRRSKLFGLALVSIVLVSMFAALPGSGHAAPLRPQAPHPAATDYILPTDAFGGLDTNFSTGFANGFVYFQAFDPSGDTQATVQINDLNASRDGLTNPVKTFTPTFPGTPYNWSYHWGIFYKLPFSLARGGEWNITIAGAAGGFSATPFWVHVYEVSLIGGAPAYLPGHDGTILFNVLSTVTGGPFSAANSLAVTASYTNENGATTTIPSKSLPASAQGTYKFTTPADAMRYSTITFAFFANITGSEPNSEMSTITLGVGDLRTPVVTLESCPSASCATSSFATGAPVYVVVQAMIVSPFVTTPAAGETVTFRFLAGGTVINSVPGSPPLSLTTNASGGAAIVFQALDSVFSTTGVNTVQVTVTDSFNPQLTTQYNATFGVLPPTAGSAILQVTLDSGQYYSGDTVTATWEIGGPNANITEGWVPFGWWAWGGNVLFANGNLSGPGTQGTFSFTVPANFGGTLMVVVEAHNATGATAADATAPVSSPSILLNPSEAYYLPGDAFQMHVATQGQAFNGATLWGSVSDAVGNNVWSGTISGGSVSLNVPKVGASDLYEFSVWAQSPTLGVFATARMTVYEASGYVLTAGVQTASNYVDGSFQPGQTISISYSLSAIGSSVLPKEFAITITPSTGFVSGHGTVVVETTSASGSVQYTIPSNTPTGAQEFEAYVLFPVSGSCAFGCALTFFSVQVEANPPVLSYEIGSGSGLTVGWLVLLLVIAAVTIVLLLMIRHGRKPVMMAPHTDPTHAWTEPPAAPAPSEPIGTPSTGAEPPLPVPGGE